eukprot:COSAG02_NODE_37252_length_444_cov_0.863768_1_plen_99_part_01
MVAVFSNPVLLTGEWVTVADSRGIHIMAAAEDAAFVERAKGLVFDVRALTIGDERLDVLSQFATDKAEAKEKADVAKAAKQSQAAKVAAEALGISQPTS